MTATHTLPPYAALVKGLSEAASAVRKLGALADELGEQTTLMSRFTLAVNSVAEVDGLAAELGVKPDWTAMWTYAATWTSGTVTVTVAFTEDPHTAPVNAAALSAICGQAAGNLSRGAA